MMLPPELVRYLAGVPQPWHVSCTSETWKKYFSASIFHRLQSHNNIHPTPSVLPPQFPEKELFSEDLPPSNSQNLAFAPLFISLAFTPDSLVLLNTHSWTNTHKHCTHPSISLHQTSYFSDLLSVILKNPVFQPIQRFVLRLRHRVIKGTTKTQNVSTLPRIEIGYRCSQSDMRICIDCVLDCRLLASDH